MDIVRSVGLFFLAGLCEIGGGYLIWLWLRQGRSAWLGLLGAMILSLYGVVATLQPASFARVYATYGGVFIAMSLLWAMVVDNYSPDRYDIIGALIALAGVAMIFYAPRG